MNPHYHHRTLIVRVFGRLEAARPNVPLPYQTRMLEAAELSSEYYAKVE